MSIGYKNRRKAIRDGNYDWGPNVARVARKLRMAPNELRRLGKQLQTSAVTPQLLKSAFRIAQP